MGVRVVFPDMGKDPSIQLIEKTITQNGTYDAITDGANGYSKVNVNVEGGGGETWNTVFEGSVTTAPEEEGDFVNEGRIEGDYQFDADTIKVTFNGVEYTCPKIDNHSYGAPLGETGYDWSEYPFFVMCDDLLGGIVVRTQTAGTYPLKIEEPQSGGSSDFSTARVTVEVTGDTSNSIIFKDLVTIKEDSEGRYIAADASFGVSPDDTPQQFTVILLNGDYGNVINYTGNISVSGSAELLEGFILIHGDCAITIS